MAFPYPSARVLVLAALTLVALTTAAVLDVPSAGGARIHSTAGGQADRLRTEVRWSKYQAVVGSPIL